MILGAMKIGRRYLWFFRKERLKVANELKKTKCS